MPVASHSAFAEGVSIPCLSHIVGGGASPDFHSLCGEITLAICDNLDMEPDNKNGGPNFLRAWRLYRQMTQEQLAEAVNTSANMIQYLETGERGLSAKWLRRLAPALDTTPGLLLEHDPHQLDSDIIEIWAHAGTRERRQISDIARTILRTGTND